MRRSFKKPRAKRVKIPKPILPQKPIRPRRSSLRTIYKDLFTSDIDQRVTALAQAMEWFDHCIVYVFWPEYNFTKLQLKHKNKAEESRSAGITSSVSTTKEREFTTAIKEYELLVNGFNPPKVSIYLRKLKKDSPKLTLRKKKLTDKYGEFLELLRTVLQPRNADNKIVDLRIDKIKSDYRIDAQGNVTFDRKLIGEVRKVSRRNGLLTGVLKLLPILSETGARVPELDTQGHKTGRTLVSNAKRLSGVYTMLGSLVKYSMTAESPRKLIRRSRKKVSAQ